MLSGGFCATEDDVDPWPSAGCVGECRCPNGTTLKPNGGNLLIDVDFALSVSSYRTLNGSTRLPWGELFPSEIFVVIAGLIPNGVACST